MWFTYSVEDKNLAHIPSVLEEVDVHDIPLGRAQAKGMPSVLHRLGMEQFVDGPGEFWGKGVTPVGADTPCLTPVGFRQETDRIFDWGEKRVREMGTLYGLYLSLSGAEQDLGRIPRDLDQGLDLSAEVPCMMFLFYIPPVSAEQAEAEEEAEGWLPHI